MTQLRRVLARLRPRPCPLCWVRPADLAVHLRTEHSEVEVRQFLESR